MQLAAGQRGNVETVIDDARMQGTVFEVGVADVHCREDIAAGPGTVGLDHQDRTGAVAQQFPVLGRQQGALECVVGHVLLDHQAAAFGLLHLDDGLMEVVVPGLLRADGMALVAELFAQAVEVGAVILLAVADQQVQAGLADARNQAGAFECQVIGLFWVDYHQDAANGSHDRLRLLISD